jgi:hypothetical protein
MKNPKKQVKGKQLIRNSTAEFLIFTGQSGEQSIEARYEDETIWLTQKLMAQLFDVTIPTVNEHLKNIFADGELPQDSVIRKFRTTKLSKTHAESEFEKYRILQKTVQSQWNVESK